MDSSGGDLRTLDHRAGERRARAIASSRLRTLDADLLDRFLAGSRMRQVPAGGIVRGVGQPGPHVELVVSGLVRVEIQAPDGRSMTVRYVRPGGLLGIASLFTQDFQMPGSNHAVVDSELAELRPDTIRRLAREDMRVATALLDELADRLLAFVAEIPGSAFTTVRQRIARHLLNTATEWNQGHRPVARITQQQLAEAVGSVREVVVRELRSLREERIVETGSRSITILDPDRLAADAGEATPADWNAGS
jgi:CRP/FNR family transcriptional regulator, cyclic AMP receptor protein